MNEFDFEKKLQISFKGMEPTQAIEDYLVEKLDRHLVHKDLITEAKAVLHQHVAHKGTKTDFSIDITLHVPKNVLRVSEKGDNMYAVIDIAAEKLGRILDKYHDKIIDRSRNKIHRRVMRNVRKLSAWRPW